MHRLLNICLCTSLLLSFSSCKNSSHLLNIEKRQHLSGFHISGKKTKPTFNQFDLAELSNNAGTLNKKAKKDIPLSQPHLSNPTAFPKKPVYNKDFLLAGQKLVNQPSKSRDNPNGIEATADVDGLRNISIEQPQKEADDNDEPKTVNKALIGLIAIIIAVSNLILLMYIPFLGLAFGLLAIVFGIKALKVDNKTSRTLGITSIIISAFTLFISALFTLLLVAGVQVFG